MWREKVAACPFSSYEMAKLAVIILFTLAG
jgi:hypothetical protein